MQLRASLDQLQETARARNIEHLAECRQLVDEVRRQYEGQIEDLKAQVAALEQDLDTMSSQRTPYASKAHSSRDMGRSSLVSLASAASQTAVPATSPAPTAHSRGVSLAAVNESSVEQGDNVEVQLGVMVEPGGHVRVRSAARALSFDADNTQRQDESEKQSNAAGGELEQQQQQQQQQRIMELELKLRTVFDENTSLAERCNTLEQEVGEVECACCCVPVFALSPLSAVVTH